MADFIPQLHDYRLTTAKIIYHMPDFQEILQEFIWQDYDIAPKYPTLNRFLKFWEKELDGPLHSVYVAKTEIITPGEINNANWEGVLH